MSAQDLPCGVECVKVFEYWDARGDGVPEVLWTDPSADDEGLCVTSFHLAAFRHWSLCDGPSMPASCSAHANKADS